MTDRLIITKEQMEAMKKAHGGNLFETCPVPKSEDEPVSENMRKCGCEQPSENYPYSDKVFELIREMAPDISEFSRQYNVSPIAVAGAIADEYNTQHGLKGALDWFQDNVLLNYMPNFAIAIDATLGFNSKLLNATKHDLGVGNIKLETAKQIYDANPDAFTGSNLNYSDIVDYLRTKRGTAQVATLYISEAQKELGPYIKDYPDSLKEAVLITYYKQGPDKYLGRYLKAKVSDRDKKIGAGEGCRACLQRDKFLEIFPQAQPTGYWDQLPNRNVG